MARAAFEVIPGGADQQQAYDEASQSVRQEQDAAKGDGGGGLFGADGRRVIQHDPGRLPQILDELGLALADYGGNVYAYNGGLARVHVLSAAQEVGPVKRVQGAVLLHPVAKAHLMELAGRAASHEKYDGRAKTYVACDCPPKVCESYLARGTWPELPTLSGFVEAPTLTLDGRVLDNPGFDAATGLYLAMEAIPDYRPPPPSPTVRDAATAVDVLFEAVESFPFVEEADRMAAVAGIILAVVRRSLPSAPMLAITAPTPGTGKTLLADTFSMVATGRRAAVISLGHDDVEAEKRLAGVLLAGDAMVLLDNVERPLGGELLCQTLSQPILKTRVLGGSQVPTVPTQALIVSTGNNLSIQGDLKRRVTMIRMDAKLERPELRPFDGEPHMDRIMRMRGALLTAALTIPLAYLAAGAPKLTAPVLGGFEDWDRLVRRPLLWLGLVDPLDASSLLREQDPDMETTRALLTAWWEVFAGDEKTASEVVKEGAAIGEGMDRDTPSHPALREALMLACGGRGEPTPYRLGYWLRGHKDRIVDGKRITSGEKDRNGVSRWRVVTGEAGLSEEIDM